METLNYTESPIQKASERYRQLVDSIRPDMSDDEVDAVLLKIQHLPKAGKALRDHYDIAFCVAIEAQVNAGDEGTDDAQYRADMISLLVGNEGIKNTKVRNTLGVTDKSRLDGREYKLLQVCRARETALQAGNDDVVQALDRYIEVSDIMPADFNGTLAKNPTVSSRLFGALGRKKDKLWATASAVVALTAVSTVTSASSGAAAEKLPYDEYLAPNDDIKEYMAAKAMRAHAQVEERLAVDDTRMKNIADTAQAIADRAPIVLDQPQGAAIEAPTRTKASPPPAERVDGSIALRVKEVAAPPTRIKASAPPPSPIGEQLAIPIPVIENPVPVPEPAPAPAPAPSIEAPAPPSKESLEILAARKLMGVNTANLPQGFQDVLPANVNWDNAGRMIEYLMVHAELTESQAIGVVANAMWESGGVHPGQEQIGGPAFGIVQWEGGRRTALEAYAIEKNKPVDDLYLQLEFMVMELKRDAWNGYAELKMAKGSEEATLIFVNKFERPGIPHIDNRLLIAHVITVVYNEQFKIAEGEQAAARKAAEKAAADEAARVVAEKEAQRIAAEKAQNEVEPFTGWGLPVAPGTPVSPQYEGHTGIDYSLPSGQPFLASAGGKIEVFTTDVRLSQNCLNALARLHFPVENLADHMQKEVHVVTMINGIEYRAIYAHLSLVTVEQGQIVKKGQEIGLTGNSGCSTGPHAHFEIRENGVSIYPKEIYG